MSVYIKDMEMPRGCASCKISRRNGKKMICPFIWKCEWNIHDPMSADHRLDGCPLVPVPEHGDLIDYDFCVANYELLHDDDGNPVYAVRMRDINIAPTIIPADKED